MKNNSVSDCLWLILLLVIIFGFFLGLRALSVPDEARYTEIPREMLLFHNFITPHLDGIKYFEKPPLMYWLQAGMIHWFGINEWALRIPTMLLALIGCLTIYFSARFLYDRGVGVLSALILASSPLYFVMAHSITLDMANSVFLTITLCSFISAVYAPLDSKLRQNLTWLMCIAAACAVLTKGLIGILLPGLVIVSWLFITHEWKNFWQLPIFSGVIIFLSITLPWHVLVQLHNPEFFHFYFIEQHFARYLTPVMHREEPNWWFLLVLGAGFFPWIIFLGESITKIIKAKIPISLTYKKEWFFVLWAAEIFIFFSFSHSKLIPYILPVFPPLAVLIAQFLLSAVVNKSYQNISIAYLIMAGSILTIVFHFSFFPVLKRDLIFISMLFILVPLGFLIFPIFSKMKLIYLFCIQIIFLWTVVIIYPDFDTRSIKELAIQLNQHLHKNDLLVSYEGYYQDLPVYTKHLVQIVDWQDELSFGALHQKNSKEILISTDHFWHLWASPHQVWAIMSIKNYEQEKKHHKLYLLSASDRNVVVSNEPVNTQK